MGLYEERMAKAAAQKADIEATLQVVSRIPNFKFLISKFLIFTNFKFQESRDRLEEEESRRQGMSVQKNQLEAEAITIRRELQVKTGLAKRSQFHDQSF